MGRIRYLGSKARLVGHLKEVLGKPTKGGQFVDLFCGTGVVAQTIVLLADWIESTNQIANIAGTYGCFLKKLGPSAKRDLILKPRTFSKKKISWKTLSKDVFNVSVRESDVAYLDSPYNKRQYAAYYHTPETIACGDDHQCQNKNRNGIYKLSGALRFQFKQSLDYRKDWYVKQRDERIRSYSLIQDTKKLVYNLTDKQRKAHDIRYLQ